MKTKRFRLLTVILAAVMMFALSVNVFAAKSNAVTKDGLTAQLFTDKDSYKAGESVKANVQVDNRTGSDAFIFAKINVPEGIKLANESAAFDVLLKDGETWTALGGAVAIGGASATANSTATGDNMQAGFWVILTVLAVCGMIALFVYGKNKKTWLSIMLCIVMVGGLVTFAVPVEAANTSGEISLSCTIQVDGKAKEVEANVSYVIYDEAEEVAEESTEATTPSEPIEESSEANSDASEESSEASSDASEESSEASSDASEESSEASSDASEESSEASSDASEESSEPVEEDEFDVYVDASFTGTSTGRKSAPYTTIQQAVEAVKALNDNMTEDIVVYIADGEYYVDEVIALGAEDGGSNGYDIIYKAESVAGVRLYGAEALTGWTEYQNGIWSVAVDDDFYTLYEDDRRAIKARYPNREYDAEYTTSKAPYLLSIDTDATNNQTIKYNTNDLSGITFADITDANIVIWPWNKCDWAHYTCGILSVDKTNGIITPNIQDGAPYGLAARYYIEGMLELLDAPGEFHYDSDEGKLYYMPLNGGNPNEDFTVYAPVTQEIFHVTNAQNIVFDGISFEKTDFVRFMKIWYDHDVTRLGAITLDTTNDIEIVNCRFKNTGLNGVWITGVSSNNTIDSCLFENIGINGVLLRGDRTKAEKIKDNVISNCLMHDLGELSVECGGVTAMSTQGTVVENCEFYNSPRNAVSLRGNAAQSSPANSDNLTLSGQAKDTIVRNCLVYEMNQDSGDTGALHTAGISFLSANGNTNYFENIYIDNVVAHPSMKDFKPNGYFGDYYSNYQSFKNIKITNNDSAVNGNFTDAFTDMYQIRYNLSDASTGIYENVSWVLGFEEKQMNFVNMGLREDFPFELTADYNKVKQAVILQVGSKSAIANGIVQNAEAESVEISGTVLVPVSFVVEGLGGSVQLNGQTATVTLNGTPTDLSVQTVNNLAMVSLAEVEKLGVDANSYDGLIVISETANLFDQSRDDMTLKRLGNYLFDNYQAENFKYDVIESPYTDYTLTGTALNDGESYMVRSAGSWNATYYAVSKADGKVRLIVKEDNYSIPVYTELDTAAASVSFVKAEGKLKVIVDGTEVYSTDNPFDAVYYGTYTENGANTLNATNDGMSILPAEATTLGILVGSPQIKPDGITRYYVNLLDKLGNTYDLTEEAITITSSDETVVKCENGYVIPVGLGNATLTAKATIDGVELTSTAVKITVGDETGALLKEDFSSGLSSAWTVKNNDSNSNSYVKVNDAGKLEIHDAGPDANNQNAGIQATRTFDDCTGDVTIEFDFSANFGGTADNVNLYVTGNNRYNICLFAYEGTFKYMGSDNQMTDSNVTCSSGETYRIKLVANATDMTYDCYIDGEKAFSSTFRKQEPVLNGLFFGTGGSCNGTTFTVDNIVVTEGGTTPALFEDNFNSGLSNAWVINNADNNADSYVKVIDGQLEVHDGSTANDLTKNQIEARVTLSETHEGEILSFEFDFTPVKFGSTGSAANLYLYGDGGGQAVAVMAQQGGFTFVFEGGVTETYGTCTAGETYRIKYVTDTSDKTVDFYVNDELVKENILWRKQQRTYVNSIGFGSNTNAIDSTFKIDNVVISKEEVKEVPAVAQDDFNSGLSNSWVINNADSNADSYVKVSEGQLEVHDGSKETDLTKKQIEARLTLSETHEGEVLSFEFDFTPVKFGSTASAANLYLYGDNGGQAVAVMAQQGGFTFIFEGGVTETYGTCTAGETYRIKYVTDTSDKTVDFYVNDELVKENILWRKQQRTYVNSIGFGSNTNAIDTTFKIDNLVISKVE